MNDLAWEPPFHCLRRWARARDHTAFLEGVRHRGTPAGRGAPMLVPTPVPRVTREPPSECALVRPV